ncbi:MAG: hypothetical protein HRU70_06790 [Phycisphaeraceae bacterium]|nr:MAG: hypothetical protein HRU70_06790 [Phycisphaeraceae bacterium]
MTTAITPEQQAEHRAWLRELTGLPTAAGREWRVVRWVERWASARPGVVIEPDPSGNLVIRLEGPMEPGPGAPGGLWLTAHLDHPAFVVERVDSPVEVVASFRGGVMPAYFAGSRVRAFTGEPHRSIGGFVEGRDGEMALGELWRLRLDEATSDLIPGDIARWDLPDAFERDGLLFTHACDDLAALAASLAAFDVWRLSRRAEPGREGRALRLLLTRAEEVGFIGAIAACKHGTVPPGARVIALENSRASADSPVGDGPIVRVGDRLSVFHPGLTGAIAARAEEVFGPAAARPPAAGSERPRWQRKLMSGGACESSVFRAYGHEAGCVCLALGNYHNMGDLDAVQGGTNTSPPAPAPEFISLRDFDGMVELLAACAERLPEGDPVLPLVGRLWLQRSGVLDQ